MSHKRINDILVLCLDRHRLSVRSLDEAARIRASTEVAWIDLVRNRYMKGVASRNRCALTAPTPPPPRYSGGGGEAHTFIICSLCMDILHACHYHWSIRIETRHAQRPPPRTHTHVSFTLILLLAWLPGATFCAQERAISKV